MANKRTHPKEWNELIDICNREDWDNPKFKEYRALFYGAKNIWSGNKKRGAKPNRIKVTKPDGSETIYESKHIAAKALGVTKRTIENYRHRGTGKTTQSPFYGWKVESLPPLVSEYGLYIQGVLVHQGTLNEIAKAHNSTVYHIKAYLYDTEDNYLPEVKYIGEKEADE